ncbi:MAG: hypothetical protein KGR17_08480 [Acidobacteria bacterium]|nr:hypothetical protein [Acidobacteriota bacterium]
MSGRRVTVLGPLMMALIVTGAACGGNDGAAGRDAGPTGDSAPAGPTTSTTEVRMVTADDIPVAHTPPGFWTTFPGPVLATCTEPLAAGAPDLRGLWRVTEAERGGAPVPEAIGIVQRIEQCGDRIVITAKGIVHDMRADGTEANGVHDVAERSGAPIVVVATYENGWHVLRPVGVPGVEVRRRRDGDQLVWDYAGLATRSERIGGPSDPAPA